METVRVLSFGAGTQSSAVLGLIEQGKLPPVDFAVFADTGCEPDAVYDWLHKMKNWAKTEIIIAQRSNLYDDTIKLARGEVKRLASLPFFTKNTDDYEDRQSIMKRQCTSDYKIAVVQKAIRERLGYKSRQWVKHKVEMLLAMSLDEVDRMRDSREKWIKNKYPLIFDVPMHRQQSIDFVRSLGLGEPPRSACLMCPFHSNQEWRWLRDNEPHNWKKAVELDKACRKLPRLNSETYLHNSLVPLDEVNLDEQTDQMDLFRNDCSGFCGS